MGTEHVTRGRMAVLALIRDGKIRRDRFASYLRYEHVETRRELSARTADVMARGWAETPPEPARGDWLVLLTPKGRTVLSEWEKSDG